MQEVQPQTDVRVTVERIQELMARVVYHNYVIGTSTFVHAYLDGKFSLATGHSACVDPANFNREKGLQYASERAVHAAREKLWELEGYSLYKEINK